MDSRYNEIIFYSLYHDIYSIRDLLSDSFFVVIELID